MLWRTKGNYCMVTTFAVVLVLIFLVEIAAAIAAYVYKDTLRTAFENSFKDGMNRYNTTKDVRDSIDLLQKEFKCCGANSSEEWSQYQPFIGTSNVPDSCCVNITSGCGSTSASKNKEGCVDGINNWIKRNVGIVAGVALGIALFEILGVVFACCLMKGIRSGYEVM
ncbi:hypothetical protein GDO86_004273 [Hymenochirus boettgeri]|uniref:CD63 antigen n=1 Tax=Hymenochirus boettgeri TaxID=247094 RepID=A0A8T2KD49_9PIPI|nr:hypothetical protein GDO86_004273 [Hymenochirus boettgeri]